MREKRKWRASTLARTPIVRGACDEPARGWYRKDIMLTLGRGSAVLGGTLLSFLVVSAVRANAPAGRYQVAADTVTDTKTHLTWRRKNSPPSEAERLSASAA